MYKELQKLMEKKKGKPMDENYKKAKMGMLSELKDSMGSMMGDEMKGMKKVTVASKDSEGLKEGLDKAEDLVSQLDAPKDEQDDAHEVMGNVADESEEEMSKEDILAAMEMLKEKLKKMA